MRVPAPGRPILADEIGALLRPRIVVLAVLVMGSLATATLLAFGPGDAALALDGTLAVLLLEGTGLGLLLTEGLVARDLRRGWTVLWLQKPVSPVGFYLARFIRAIAVAVVLATLTAGAAALLFEVGRGEGAGVIEVLPVVLLVSGTLATVTFGLSAWRAHPDVLMALAFVFLATPLSAVATVNPDAFGPASAFLRLLAPPVDAMVAVGGVWMDGPGPSADEVLHAFGYPAAWIVVAVVGLARSTSSPFPSGG